MAAKKEIDETKTTKKTTKTAARPKAASTTKRKQASKKTETKTVKKATNLGGRPRKVDPDELAKLALEYAFSCPFPIVAEFAHQNGITREYLYELAANEKAKGNEQLSYGIKMISEQKEIVLEKGGLSGTLQPTLAIFSLKQLGWKDKQEVEQNISVDEESSGVILLAPVLEREKLDE